MVAVLPSNGGSLPFTGAGTLFDDGLLHTVEFDAAGAIDSTSGAHFGTVPAAGPGFIINSDGSITLSLNGVSVFAITHETLGQVCKVSTVGGQNVIEVNPRTDVIPLDINSFGGVQPAIRYLGAPNFNGEFLVLQGGAVVIGQGTAPADGELVAGQVALWFDDTDGAAKLMLKGKQADGTVKTGSVNVQT